MSVRNTTRRAPFAASSAVSRVTTSVRLRLIASLLGLPLIAGCSSGETTARVFDAEPRVFTAPATVAAAPPTNLAAPLAPGTVQLNPGAFTDVLQVNKAELKQGTRPRITAELGNLVDTAPLLQLEVKAMFYDGDGRYLGSASYVEEGLGEDEESSESAAHTEDGEDPGVLPLTIEPDSPLPGDAASATITVVQFVTE